jgi:hypothetical protein
VGRIDPEDVAIDIEQPDFTNLIQQFIHDQAHPDSASDTSDATLPTFYGKITRYPSAIATFHSPSDISGIGGMRRERI